MRIANLRIRVQAGARRSAVIGFAEDGVLRVAVQAPPVEGAANRALVELLARYFHTSRSRVRLVQGEKSKIKTFEILDFTDDSLKKILDTNLANSNPKGEHSP